MIFLLGCIAFPFMVLYYIIKYTNWFVVRPWALTWDDEHSVLVVEVAVSPQFFGWIFSLGNGVKVTAPETVVTQIRKYGERFMENYSGRGLVT